MPDDNCPKCSGELRQTDKDTEAWFRIKKRVEILSGDHYIGIAHHFDILGEAPEAIPTEPKDITRGVG